MSVLNSLEEIIAAPIKHLEVAIDYLVAEQKPTLDLMEEFEESVKTIVPDFDAPSLTDLKIPLDSCPALVRTIVLTIKQEIPEQLENLAKVSFAGRIAFDKSTFDGFVVAVPLALVFLCNAGVAVAQVFLMSVPETESVPERSLQQVDFHTATFNSSAVNADVDFSASFLPNQGSFMQSFQPALVQVLLSFLQVGASLLLLQGPRICATLNNLVLTLELQVNDIANQKIAAATHEVVDSAFQKVKTQADMVFPKFRSCTSTLLEAIETAHKAEMASQAALKAARGLGF